MTKEESVQYMLDLIRSENDSNHIDYLVPGYAAKKIISYQSIREDLILCRGAMQMLLSDSVDSIVKSCLYCTCISQYGRCFTDASSSQMSKLDEADFDNAHSNLLEVHRELMNLRHNFIAHRGSTENEFHFAYLSLNVNDLSRQVRVRQLKRIGPKKEKLADYLSLFDYLISVSEKKFYDAGVKLWSHMLKDYQPELLAQLIICGPGEKK